MKHFFVQKHTKDNAVAKASFQRGFTLIEMIVSLSLFISVMTVAASSMLSIIDANRKSQATNTAVDNLNFVIDDMSRSLRTGKSWSVTSLAGGNSKITFVPQGKTAANSTSYFAENNQIKMQVGSGPVEALTDPALVVEKLDFYLDPQTAVGQPPAQPYLHLLLKAYVGNKAKYRSDVNISTTISQRTLNR